MSTLNRVRCAGKSFELMVVVAGDTLTYTLGAMRPETAKASVITADEDAKQLALNKVS